LQKEDVYYYEAYKAEYLFSLGVATAFELSRSKWLGKVKFKKVFDNGKRCGFCFESSKCIKCCLHETFGTVVNEFDSGCTGIENYKPIEVLKIICEKYYARNPRRTP
jgi:hypothetical protein